MSVQVIYSGRTGNKLFQYIAGRVFAEKNRLNLITEFPDSGLISPTPHKDFDNDRQSGRTVIVNKHSFDHEDEIRFHGHNTNYVFDDYFHNGDFFSKNCELIKTFFQIPSFEKNTKDIVLHLRLFDYLLGTDYYNPTSWSNSEIVHPDFYLTILEREEFENVYIVVDEIRCEWEKKYLAYFEKYNPIIVTKTPREDFNFLMSFDKIINSNSTFSYWASFFSDASKIYTFQRAGSYGPGIKRDHVKNLNNIKNCSISIDEKFYFGE